MWLRANGTLCMCGSAQPVSLVHSLAITSPSVELWELHYRTKASRGWDINRREQVYTLYILSHPLFHTEIWINVMPKTIKERHRWMD